MRRSRTRFGPDRIYKDRVHGKLCGVCAGLGDYFGIDPTILRVAAVLLAIFGFFLPIVIAYLILCCVLEDAHPRSRNAGREAYYETL